jgi:hypothetical protein
VERGVERMRQLGRLFGGAARRVRAVDADDDLVHSNSPWIRRFTSAGRLVPLPAANCWCRTLVRRRAPDRSDHRAATNPRMVVE